MLDDTAAESSERHGYASALAPRPRRQTRVKTRIEETVNRQALRVEAVRAEKLDGLRSATQRVDTLAK